MSRLTNLEEINMQYLAMIGYIDSSFTNLANLKFINIAFNNLYLSLPDTGSWKNLKNLEHIELQGN